MTEPRVVSRRVIAMSCVVGISVSPLRVSAEVRNLEDGDQLATYSTPIVRNSSLEPGELDAASVIAAFDQVLADTAAHAPVALSIVGPLHALVVLDGAGAAIRPVLLADDQRSAPDAGWCNKKIAPPVWAASVGSVPSAALTVTKLSWLHRSEPDVWDRVASFVSLQDYLRGRLCDSGASSVTDRGGASGTGYWSSTRGVYDNDVLTLIDKDRVWAEAVPAVVDPTASVGARGSMRIAVGTGDLMALALALDVRHGDVLVTVGERTRVTGASSVAVADESGVVSCFAAAGAGYLPTVSLNGVDGVADTVDGVLLAMSTLSTAGIDVSGRLILCGEGNLVEAVARECSSRELRTVELCVDPTAVAAGAAVQAGACALGQWPLWRAIATTAV